MNPGGGRSPNGFTHPGHDPTLTLRMLSVTGVPAALGVAAVLGVTAMLGVVAVLSVVRETSSSSPVTAVSGVAGVAALREELLAAVVPGVSRAATVRGKLLATFVFGVAEVAVSPDKFSALKYPARGPLGSETSEVDARAASDEAVSGYQVLCINPGSGFST